MSFAVAESIFLLGATGYVGGQVLISLAADFPALSIRALARNVTPSMISQLQSLHPKIEAVEGSLSDVALIEEEAAKADVVINVAVAGDMGSVNAIISGLRRQHHSPSSSSIPIYIHMSGAGIIGDNARGDLLVPERLWTDIDFDLKHVKTNLLAGACQAIVDASKTGKLRTMILFPGLIYGIGPGIQKISLPQRFFLNSSAQAGHSGTFGPGRNILGLIHLKDVADAVALVLRGALNGHALGEGDKGFYFVSSKYMISAAEFAGIIGDTLFKNGLISQPGSLPYSTLIADAAGPFGYTIFGSSGFFRSDRLSNELGWTAQHTELSSISDSLPGEIELAVKEMGLVFKRL